MEIMQKEREEMKKEIENMKKERAKLSIKKEFDEVASEYFNKSDISFALKKETEEIELQNLISKSNIFLLFNNDFFSHEIHRKPTNKKKKQKLFFIYFSPNKDFPKNEIPV